LRKVAGQANYLNAQKYEAFAKRAELGEFDDFADTHACPITQLHTELTEAGFTKFAARVADGEFDATVEESDEWANSPAGREAMAGLQSTHTIGDAPVEAEYAEVMKQIASAVDMMLNGTPEENAEKKNGFILMMFPMNNHDGRCNYMSNAKREDVVIMLKEQIKRFEGQAEVVGHA